MAAIHFCDVYAILIWILTSSLIENRIQLHTIEIMNLKFMAAIVYNINYIRKCIAAIWLLRNFL